MTEAAALAERALAAASSDPQHAVELARRAVASSRDPGPRSTAERAWGLALREARDLRGSTTHLRRAVRVAEDAGLVELGTDARMSLVGTLALAGRTAAALQEARIVRSRLRGIDAARIDVQQANVLVFRGELDEAFALYARAEPVLRRKEDALWLCRLHNGRGLALASRGDTTRATADLTEAERLLTSLGEERAAAAVRQNLGYVAAFAGDLPAALRWFDRADEWFRARDEVDSIGLADRCRALLGARLVEEARATAEEAVRVLDGQGLGTYAAEARLLCAEAALADDDPASALQAAREARRVLTRQRRSTWTALARSVEVQAAWEAGDRSRSLFSAAQRAADALARAGWPARAVDARLIAARIALGLGDFRTARRELALVARTKQRGPADLRARAWEAVALVRAAEGDGAGALQAARAGLRVLDVHRAALGATELRARAAGHGERLGRFGLSLAVGTGRAASVLAWAERVRAASMLPSPRVPDDDRLAADLAELRAVANEREAAALAGRDTTRLLARQAALEASIRRRSRHAVGDGTAPLEPPSLRHIVDALDGRALVEWSDVDGGLHAVTVVDGRATLHALASSHDVARELDGVRFALHRLARGHGSEASLDAARQALDRGAARLDDLLLAPLSLPDRPLVLVPTGPLHAVPWSLLPSCSIATVAPSAAMWLRAERTDATTGDIVVVAGPGLAHAGREVSSVRRRYEQPVVLTGVAARADEVAAALARARLAHVAAHGRFRHDNPLLSSLAMADGPLTVYDLERLHRAPSTLVLSACESGLSAVHPGEELMGLAAALLRLGTQAVVAGLLPVPDDGTRLLMQELHRRLATGERPAPALAGAQAVARRRGGAMAIAAAAFVCLGAG